MIIYSSYTLSLYNTPHQPRGVLNSHWFWDDPRKRNVIVCHSDAARESNNFPLTFPNKSTNFFLTAHGSYRKHGDELHNFSWWNKVNIPTFCGWHPIFNGNFRILKWRYVTTISKYIKRHILLVTSYLFQGLPAPLGPQGPCPKGPRNHRAWCRRSLRNCWCLAAENRWERYKSSSMSKMGQIRKFYLIYDIFIIYIYISTIIDQNPHEQKTNNTVLIHSRLEELPCRLEQLPCHSESYHGASKVHRRPKQM